MRWSWDQDTALHSVVERVRATELLVFLLELIIDRSLKRNVLCGIDRQHQIQLYPSTNTCFLLKRCLTKRLLEN